MTSIICGQLQSKKLNGKFQKQFIDFKLHTTGEQHGEIFHDPAQETNHRFSRITMLHTLLTHLSLPWYHITGLCSRNSVLFNNDPKAQQY
jgi:hypothetical protein